MESLASSLRTFFIKHGFNQSYWIGYSGGLDSHVLLHLCATLKTELPLTLRAVHVNHGLSPNAQEWAQHAETQCHQLNIECSSYTVNAIANTGDSPEDIAREKRYAIFSKLMAPNDILLTAHQQNDQAETVLLQMFRGAGIKGLAAMPTIKPFANGFHARPLLRHQRKELEDYAKQHQLQWINDESNENTAYTRNFLRHEVLPLLQTRWPTITHVLSRVAEHCAEADGMMNELAQSDLTNIISFHAQHSLLNIESLALLSPERQRLVLRQWIHQSGYPLPSAIKLQHIQHDFLSASEDKYPHMVWQDVELRRYQHHLYLMKKIPHHDASASYHWDTSEPLVFPQLGQLNIKNPLKKYYTVRFRQGGELFQLPGRKHHSELKKLFQEWGVPPWQRDRIPLIFDQDKLLGVAGYALTEELKHVEWQSYP